MNHIDETGNIRGKKHKWRALKFIGRINNASKWLCECTACGATKYITGSKFRSGFCPKCENCCWKCGQTRDIVKFKSLLSSVCCSCQKNRLDKWRDRTGFKAKKQQWDIANTDLRKKYCRQRYLRAQSCPYLFIRERYKQCLNKEKRICSPSSDYRTRCQASDKSKHTVEITLVELHQLWDSQNGQCAITQMPMTFKRNDPYAISIDRIDSTIGYTRTNVQLVCQWVNFAKNKLSNDQIKSILLAYKNLAISSAFAYHCDDGKEGTYANHPSSYGHKYTKPTPSWVAWCVGD